MTDQIGNTHRLLVARLCARHALGLCVALAIGATAGWALTLVVRPEFKSESVYAVVANSGAAGSGLGNLGGLAGLTGLTGGGAGRMNLDQYVALIQNNDTLDAIIQRHRLAALWDQADPEKNRRRLKKHLRIWIGQKDQLIRIEVVMPEATLAAGISNELGQLLGAKTAELASAEAKSRRHTLEPEVKRARAALEAAQQQLVRAQLDPSLARADSRALGELVARLQGELGAVETRLAVASQVIAPGTAEMRQLLSTRDSLRERLDRIQKAAPSGDFGYMEAFREFKYQEAVLEILMKQYETARIDELKGGQYIHVVQPARKAERPYFPDPLVLIATGALSAALLYVAMALFRSRKQVHLDR